MNDTNLTNLSHISPNNIIVEQASHLTIGGFFEDTNLFWVFVISSFLILYFSLSFIPFDIRKSIRILLSLSPAIVVDLLISFGIFTFTFPLNYTITIDRGYMFISLLNKIMTYEIFAFYTSPLTLPFISTASETTDSIFVLIFGFLNAGIDSIADFIFFTILFYYLISLFENKIGSQINHQIAISIILASIPTFLYSLFISNPFHEIKEVIKTTNGMIMFFNSGNIINILFVFVLFMVNFILIISIIFIFVESIINLYMKIYYNKRDIEFTLDYVGLSIFYTIAYSILFLLHSDYRWYVVLPGLALLQMFRTHGSNMIKQHKQNVADNERITRVVESYRGNIEQPVHDEFSSKNILIAVIILSAIIIIYYMVLV